MVTLVLRCTQEGDASSHTPELCFERKSVNRKASLLGEVPQKSKVHESLHARMGTLFDHARSGQQATE